MATIFNKDNTTAEELAQELEKSNEVYFIDGDTLYAIWETDQGEDNIRGKEHMNYMINLYDIKPGFCVDKVNTDELGENEFLEEVDGGLCIGTPLNAVCFFDPVLCAEEEEYGDTHFVVCWPNSQNYMDNPNFYAEAVLINSEKGLKKYGSSAYMIPNDMKPVDEDYTILASENKAMAEFLELLGFTQDDIRNISKGCEIFKKSKKSINAIVVMELEVDKDISKKYPNFIFNYNSPNEFLLNELSSYNAKIPLDKVEVLREMHISLDPDGNIDEDFQIDDIGYRTKLLRYKIS